MTHTKVLVNSKAIADMSSLKFSTTFDMVPANSSVCVSRSKISSSVKIRKRYRLILQAFHVHLEAFYCNKLYCSALRRSTVLQWISSYCTALQCITLDGIVHYLHCTKFCWILLSCTVFYGPALYFTALHRQYTIKNIHLLSTMFLTCGLTAAITEKE